MARSRRGSKPANSNKNRGQRRGSSSRIQMVRYPSIVGMHQSNVIGQPCIAFEKYDGSNLQFSWDQNQGWHRSGTRKRTVEPDNPLFGSAIKMFQDKYADGIINSVRRHKEYRNAKSLTAFCEFYGDNTFSGLHVASDEKRLKLFDILIDEKFVLPRDFVYHFGELDIATVLYEGEFSKAFVDRVRAGEFDCGEGVVAKGVTKTQRRKGKTEQDVWMVKIKTQSWLDELQRRASESPDKFESEWQDNQREQSHSDL